MILKKSSILILFFLGFPLFGEGETFHCYYQDGTYRDLNLPPQLLLDIKGKFLQVEEKHRDLNPPMNFYLGGYLFAVEKQGADSLLEACYPGIVSDRDHFKPPRAPAEIRVSGYWMGYYSNSILSYTGRAGYPVVVQFDQSEQKFFRLNSNYFDYLSDSNLSEKKPIRAPLPTLRDPLPALSNLAGITVQYAVIEHIVENLKGWVENEVFRLSNQDSNKKIMKFDGKQWIDDKKRIIVDRNPEPQFLNKFTQNVLGINFDSYMGEALSNLPFPMSLGAKWVKNKINMVLHSYETKTIQETLSFVVAWSTECALIRAIELYVSVTQDKLEYCKKMPSMANKKEESLKINDKEIEEGFALSPEDRENAAPEIIKALEAISQDLIAEEKTEERKQERLRSGQEAKPLPDEGLDELFDSVNLEDRKPTSSFGKMEKFIKSVEHEKKHHSSITYEGVFRETFHYYQAKIKVSLLKNIYSIIEKGLQGALLELDLKTSWLGSQIKEDALNRIKNTEIPSYPAFLKVSFEDVDVLYRGRAILHEDQFEDLGQEDPSVMKEYETTTAQFYRLFYEKLNVNVLTGSSKDKAQKLLIKMRESATSLMDYSQEKASGSYERLKDKIQTVLDTMKGYSAQMSALFKSNPENKKSDDPVFHSMTIDPSLPSDLGQPMDMDFDDHFFLFKRALRTQIETITAKETGKWFWGRKTERQIFEEALKETPVDKQLREDPRFEERLKSFTP